MGEDRRAVLAANIPALAVGCGGVAHTPERLQQLLVAHLPWVEPHLDRLGVAGVAAADLLVAWVDTIAARVADCGFEHAVDVAERGLNAPEASGGEGTSLDPVGGWSRLRRRTWSRLLCGLGEDVVSEG